MSDMTNEPSALRANGTTSGATRRLLNRVPEITLYFWIIKILATTVGETASDYLSDTQGLGLPKTMAMMAVLLVVLFALQFWLRRYVPVAYWAVVVVISVIGTNITDQLHDGWGIANTIIAPAFAVVLAIVFAVWYASEGTLSIHTVHTARRERFYWLAVLFTFALGTAGGDLVAESMNLGYWVAASIFGAIIAAVYVVHRVFGLNAVLSFWMAYILTRPFGASMGDGMAQKDLDGLGLGTTATSLIYLAVIALVVAFLTVTKIDREDTVVEGGTEHGEFEAPTRSAH